MNRGSLDALIDERVRYTIRYADEHSPFYRHWFRENGIDPKEIRVHEDLLSLPVISGRTIREHQPPGTADFQFLSADWKNVFTIQETSGTSGTPKSFFLAWEDWKRYAEKYSRSFTSQGFGAGDRVVQRWCYSWAGGHVRGVDLFRVGDGKVTEKLSYVKG